MSAVRASGLSKRFDATVAVDEVDLAVPAGQVHGLLGANGAGKTTLLRLLFGLIAPDDGVVELLGRRLAGPGSAALDEVGGFVEEPAFYPYLSGAANLRTLARLDGDEVSPTRIDAVLERVGLQSRGRDRVSGYSTGMRQRLGIAAALLRDPRVLLLDEPTSGLDPAGAREVAELLRALAGVGVAVLLSSHQIGELEKVCDAYSFMRLGRLVWHGSASELQRAAPASAYALQTSDDARALAVAGERVREAAGTASPGRLTVSATESELDELVLTLARSGIAVRRLELLASPLETMFFALAGDEPAGAPSAGDPGRTVDAAGRR